MITEIFPSTFYSCFSIPNKEEVFIAIQNAKEDEEKVTWNRLCKVAACNLYVSEIVPFLKPSIEVFVEEFGSLKRNVEVLSIWKSTYTKGSFQEVHDHLTEEESQISSVIFLDDYVSGAAQFYFFNGNLVSKYLGKLMKHPQLDSTVELITPKRGDIIFFPSYMLHGVSSHGLNKPRTTVSFNMKMI